MAKSRKARLLDGAENIFGPIGSDIRARIVAYLENPTEKGWDDINGIIISDKPMLETLWQAVCRVDPTFPKTGPRYDKDWKKIGGWERIPDAVLLARAIRTALGKRGANEIA